MSNERTHAEGADYTGGNLLAAALVAAQASAKGVHKDSRTSFGPQYNYSSTESLILEAQRHLSAHGLALVPCSVSMLVGSVDTAVALLERRYALVHKSGEERAIEQVWPVVPGKGRPIDKAVAAAYTASLGYMLRDLLLLARVEKGTDLDDREPEPPPKAESHVPHAGNAPEEAPPRRGPEPRETPPEPPNAHQEAKWHSSFSASKREELTTWTRENFHLVLTYEDLRDFCKAQGWEAPSGWLESSRQDLKDGASTWGDEFMTFCARRISVRTKAGT